MKVPVQKNNQQIKLTKKEDNENAIHQGKMKKFTQTNQSLEMTDLLIEELGFLGNAPQHTQMFNRNCNPSPPVRRY